MGDVIKVIVIILVIAVIGMRIWSVADPDSYNAYMERVEKENAEREEQIQAEREAKEEEERLEEERKRAEDEARICDNHSFDSFARAWNRNHPDNQISKDMVEESSDLVGDFRFDVITVRMAYHEGIGNEPDCYRYGLRAKQEYSFDDFYAYATPFMKDVFGLSEDEVESIRVAFKNGTREYVTGNYRYKYNKNDAGGYQAIWQYDK